MVIKRRFVATCFLLLLAPTTFAEDRDFLNAEQWKRNVKFGGDLSQSLASETARAKGVNLPEGFRPWIEWDRQPTIFVIAVGASDPYGIGIFGTRRGDKVEILAVSGEASFDDQDTGEIVGSIIKIVGVGAAAAAENPAVAVAANQAATYAKELFGESGDGGKKRDAFGSGERCEGGVMVCLPENGGIPTSKQNCFRRGGPRIAANYPNHIDSNKVLFPISGQQRSATISGDGILFVAPWDRNFSDNSGYYLMYLRLSPP